jgi:hypothetical protein
MINNLKRKKNIDLFFTIKFLMLVVDLRIFFHAVIIKEK